MDSCVMSSNKVVGAQKEVKLVEEPIWSVANDTTKIFDVFISKNLRASACTDVSVDDIASLVPKLPDSKESPPRNSQAIQDVVKLKNVALV